MQRPANFEEIKDANQLQEFLAIHKVKAGNKKSAPMPGVVATSQNEYQGMKQKPVKPINPKKLLSDRYGKESARRTAEPVNDYSADGEGSAEKRFFWQNVGTSSPDWQAIAFGGLSAAKPDLTATSKISVKVVDGSTVTIQDYHGTSASAAVNVV